MKLSPFFAAPLLLALAACTTSSSTTRSLDSLLENPLYAERYYDDLVEQMVTFTLQEDPILEDEAKKNLIEKTRADGLRAAGEAGKLQREGMFGQIVSDFGYAIGEVLLLDGTLYIGPDLEVIPGPDLHIHLTAALDPRDGTYPDESALDLGPIADLYGAHTYTLPADAPQNLRTLVLYDHKLERVYGFAQLSVRQ